VLRPEHHDRLVANIDQIAHRSGLGVAHRHLIWTTAELKTAEMGWCQAAVDMLRSGDAWSKEKIGICYTQDQPAAEKTMLAMAGLLVRNFVDARVMSRMDVVAERKENKGPIEASVILVPDFALPEYVETMPAWEKTAMMEFVHERIREGMPTCLFVGVSMDMLKSKLPSVHADLHGAFKVEAAA
jgi:hypothetical protein